MSKLILINSIDTLRKESYGVKYNQYKRLYEQCQQYLSMYLPNEHPQESTTYMGIAIMNLSLMYLISQDSVFLSEAKRFIFKVCGYKNWGNAHLVNVDLSASWILFGLSLAYNWLKDDFTSYEAKIIYNKLVLQSKIMYDYKIETEGHGWATNYFQNHNWINLTGLACAGYALKTECEYAKNYIEMAKENFEIVYSLLPEDGSNYEGVVYWRYGGMWLFIYADLLKSEEQIDYFKTCDYLKNTFYYRLYQAAPNLKKQLNFGDCHDRYSGHTACVYYKVASEYNNEYAQYLGNKVINEFLYEEQYQSKVKPGILPEAGFELLWFNPEVAQKSPEDLPLTRYFEDLGLITIKNGWNNTSSILSFKCGYPGGEKQWVNGWDIYNKKRYNVLSLSHHHPDNLSYILVKGDSFFVVDDGYNRNITPHNHNVLLVDGQQAEVMDVNDVYMSSVNKVRQNYKNFDPVKDYYGEIKYFKSDAGLSYFKGDSAKTYKKSLEMKEVSRLVLTFNLDYIIFFDKISSNLEHTYQTLLNTDMYPKKEAFNKYTYKNLNNKMNYTVFSDKTSCFEVISHEVKSVMTTQEPDKCVITEFKCLSYKNLEKTKEHQFIEVLTLESILDNSYSILRSEDYISVKTASYCDYIITGKNFKNISTDALVAYIKVVENKIVLAAIIEGTYLKINGKDIIVNAQNDEIRSGLNEIFE